MTMHTHITANYSWRTVVLGLFALVIAAAGYWYATSQNTIATLKNGIVSLFNQSHFHLKDINIVGRQNANIHVIMYALDLKQNTQIYTIDIQNMQKKIQALGWIKNVRIKRNISGRLNIFIEEHTPRALWQSQNTFSLITLEGHKITDNISLWGHLPHVVGRGAEKHLPDLFTLLNADPEMSKIVKSVIRVGNRRWDILLKSNITVQLPEFEPIKAWLKLKEIIQKHQILEREIEVIDLRIADRLSVRLTPRGYELYGKNTQEYY